MSRLLLVAVLAFVLAGFAAPAARAGVVARVDLSEQRIHVSVNGRRMHSWAISSGRKGYATPTGSYRPKRLHRSWYSRKYDNAPMPHSIFFRGGYAIHGTNHVRNLGRPASHGCIRLAPRNAAALYSLVRRHGPGNTRIVITR